MSDARDVPFRPRRRPAQTGSLVPAATKRVTIEQRSEYLNPLSQLVIGNPFRSSSLFDGQDPASRDFRLEMLDATYEDANGRLPHEPGYVAPVRRAPTAEEIAARREADQRAREAYEQRIAARAEAELQAERQEREAEKREAARQRELQEYAAQRRREVERAAAARRRVEARQHTIAERRREEDLAREQLRRRLAEQEEEQRRQLVVRQELATFCPRCAIDTDRSGYECPTCATPLVRPVIAEPPRPVQAVPPPRSRRTFPKVAPASRPGLRGWEPTEVPDLMAALKPAAKPIKRKGPLTEAQIREAAREFLDANLNMAETARRMFGRTHHTNLATLQGQLRLVWEQRGWNLRHVRGTGDRRRAAARATIEAYLAAPMPRDTGMTYSGTIPPEIVWEAAWLYYYDGLGFKRVADRLWPNVDGRRLAASPNSLMNTLHHVFERNGWPRRDRIEATRAASFKHGLKARGISREDDVRYRRWLKRQTSPARPRCAGETDGRRCRSKAMKGSRFCFAHDPSSRPKRLEILSRRRQVRDRNMLPAEPFALWLAGRLDELGSYKAVAAATTLSPKKVSELVERKGGKATVMRSTVTRALAAAGGSIRLEDLYAIADERETEAIAA